MNEKDVKKMKNEEGREERTKKKYIEFMFEVSQRLKL